MKYLSVCSGIEAASVAWEQLGWEPVSFSEIEPFPCAVLRHRFPHVPLHGDFTALIENPPACDVLVGGTPCQAFSVAGSRRSLEDARGNLTLAYVELANAIDRRNLAEGKEPCITVWENVPGVFSTSDNAFGCFLRGLAGGLSPEDGPLEPPGGKWTHAGIVVGPQRAVAWRVLDAQYFGLAQRRQRVFVVSSARDGFDPSQVLLEWEGVRRDSAPSREARQNPAAASGVSSAERGGEHGRGHGRGRGHDGRMIPEVTGAITSRYGGQAMGAPEVDAGLYIPLPETEVVGCLSDGAHNGGGLNGQDAYTGRILATVAPACASTMAFDSYNGTIGDASPTLCTSGDHATGNAGVLQTFAAPAIGVLRSSTLAGTVTAHSGSNAGETATPAYVVASASASASASAQGSFPWPQEVADPLTSNEAKTYTQEGSHNFRTRNVVPHVVDARVDEDAAADEPPAYCYPDADQLGYAPRDEAGDEASASTPVQAPFVFDTAQVTHPENRCKPMPGDPSHPLAAAGHAPTLVQAVPAYAVALRGREGGNTAELGGEIQPALRTGGGGSDKPHVLATSPAVLAGAHPRMVVRRLTPRECERLQGFPDDWTLIPWKNKPAVDCPDGPRYKALGNSMAVPVMRWIGRRIDAHVKGTSS